jgi:hypothetical protein
MFTPLTDAPSRMARDFSRDVDRRPEENVWLARGKGFLRGAAEGAGDVLSDMTSPASLAMMVAPPVNALRKAGIAGRAARDAEMLRVGNLVKSRPANVGGQIDVTPEYNSADDAFQALYDRMSLKKGTPGNIPDNDVARTLERERRVIERRGTGDPNDPTRRKMFGKPYDSRYNTKYPYDRRGGK